MSAAEDEQQLAMRRVERQHLLIDWLRMARTRPVSAARLADALRVSSRTIERDIENLRHSGVPIGVRKGPGGGYSFAAARHRVQLDLTGAEAAALIASLVALGPTASEPAQAAMDKLVAAIQEP